MTRSGARIVGLCERCRHARIITTERSVFWLCELAATDARFDKYPRMPVVACDGYEEGEPSSR